MVFELSINNLILSSCAWDQSVAAAVLLIFWFGGGLMRSLLHLPVIWSNCLCTKASLYACLGSSHLILRLRDNYYVLMLPHTQHLTSTAFSCQWFVVNGVYPLVTCERSTLPFCMWTMLETPYAHLMSITVWHAATFIMKNIKTSVKRDTTPLHGTLRVWWSLYFG